MIPILLAPGFSGVFALFLLDGIPPRSSRKSNARCSRVLPMDREE
jgi:hypothetical protein